MAAGLALVSDLEALRGYVYPFVRSMPFEYDDLEDVVGETALELLERAAKGRDESPGWTPRWAVLEAIRRVLKPRLRPGRIPIESVELAVLPVEPEPEDFEEFDALTAEQIREWRSLSMPERRDRIWESHLALGSSPII